MTIATRCRRVARRYRVPDGASATVSFRFPSPNGQHVELALVDVSVSGMSFAYNDELPGLESGATIAPVVLRLGSCEMHGELLVMHVTPQSPARTVCGVLFYPATDTDLVKLKSAIAGIEALHRD